MLNSWFSSVFEKRLEVVSITYHVVNRKVAICNCRGGKAASFGELASNSHKEISQDLKAHGKFLAKLGKLKEFLRI